MLVAWVKRRNCSDANVITGRQSTHFRHSTRLRETLHKGSAIMQRQWLPILTTALALNAAWLNCAEAQAGPAPVQQQSGAEQFDMEQIDALLAPIALYPDTLLTQMLIASTFPVEIVEAERWASDPAHKSLKGAALTKALDALDWDPSVKSLIPFPQALSQMNGNLGWTQQLGYAFANQQKDVLDSVQRLRRQAQAQKHLQSTPQQTVRTQAPSEGGSQETIIVEPAQPDVVYVPTYSPSTVYGPWPYPTYPPVEASPAPAYVAGTALLGGLAFGTGVAISSSLWGWSSPNWNHGNVNVNASRYNNINTNRQHVTSGTWSPSWNRTGGQRPTNLQRPAGGPVGRPVRSTGLPTNSIGRRSVPVAGNLVNRPTPQHPRSSTPANRPNLNPGSRPQPSFQGRPNSAALGQGRGGQRFQPQSGGFQRSGAFGGVGDGGRTGAFSQRGAQSRQSANFQRRGGGGGFQGRGGGGGRGGFHGRR
ncbi:DUF3300 domain-containing protein [Gluconacetobacter johannae]|uniref:DUF3300 domain-containing protein n=1 Tax=Gluconacetobacter johannae TaxID=112140 RepID=A0A7W4J5Y6_9PROT|nr:DUF3300 domain-containing protein [Gluconacetobacter johannae]MBB2175221.1 DUF3300 domain-containing protein [Gluconacetobacter johannae]